jgi:hypothetical protein
MPQIRHFIAAYRRRLDRDDANFIRLTRLAVVSFLDGDAAKKVEEICQKMESSGDE